MMKKILSLLLSLILLSAFISGAFAEALPVPESSGELYGKPWVTTYESGNLPAERTSAADDLNIYANFDLFDAHRDDTPIIQSMLTGMDEPKNLLTELIKDESFTYPGLDQLRIFYNQAADLDTIDARGIEPVRPYIDRIEAAQSIEELNAVLTDADFPFLPFLTVSISCNDMRDVNTFTLYPHFTSGDNFNADRFRDDASPMAALAGMNDDFLINGALTQLYPDMSIDLLPKRIRAFEKAYGRYALSSTLELETPYGEAAALYSRLTCGELAAKLPNFPAAGMMLKEGCDPALVLKIPCFEWMEALDAAWTEENLDMLKLIAEVNIIVECANYLTTDISKGMEVLNLISEAMTSGNTENLEDTMNGIRFNPDKRAYNACASVGTFNQLLAAIYADKFIGSETRDRLSALADDLIAAYEPLFDDTAWMSETSRAKAKEKLHAMRKCILEPDGGFYDFSGLELVPTEEGGTIIENYLRIKTYLRDLRNGITGTPARAIFAWDALGPLTANCFYDGETNSINIMPGFMTSVITKNLDTREGVMGSIGAIIAHEISHGFDSSGSQTDAYGVCEAVFDAEDRADYLAEVDKIVSYYDAIEIKPGLNVDGSRVRVEAAADLCGMQVSLRVARDIEGFDYDRFFKTYAHCYADIVPEGYAELIAPFDTHPLAHLRVNVNAQMFDEFYKTYNVKEGDGMYLAPEARLKIFG